MAKQWVLITAAVSSILIAVSGCETTEESSPTDIVFPSDTDVTAPENTLPDRAGEEGTESGDSLVTDEWTNDTADLTDEDTIESESDDLISDFDEILSEDELPDTDAKPPYDPRVEPALCGMAPYHAVP